MATTAKKTTSSAKKTQPEENLVDKAGEVARNVYLANLGIYGTLYEQGQELYRQTEARYRQTNEKARELYGKRDKIFKDLVKRGEKLQSEASKTFEKVRAERREDVREAIDKVKETVGLSANDEQQSGQGSTRASA